MAVGGGGMELELKRQSACFPGTQEPWVSSSEKNKLGMVVHAYTPSIWELEAAWATWDLVIPPPPPKAWWDGSVGKGAWHPK